MPEQTTAEFISSAGGELAKIVVGALAVGAWRTASAIRGLLPRVDALEAQASAAPEYALAEAVEVRIAEEAATRKRGCESCHSRHVELASQVRNLERQVDRLEGVTAIPRGAPAQGDPIADRGTE